MSCQYTLHTYVVRSSQDEKASRAKEEYSAVCALGPHQKKEEKKRTILMAWRAHCVCVCLKQCVRVCVLQIK